MRLNVHTDYALRILMFLSAKQAQASVDEIANAYGISRHHLMKVSQKLTELGYVTTKRGRGGGLTLGKAPETIIVGTVVRSIEPIGGFVECFDRVNNHCPVTGVCGLQGALATALGDFMARLDQYSLADLTPAPQKFAARLS